MSKITAQEAFDIANSKTPFKKVYDKWLEENEQKIYDGIRDAAENSRFHYEYKTQPTKNRQINYYVMNQERARMSKLGFQAGTVNNDGVMVYWETPQENDANVSTVS